RPGDERDHRDPRLGARPLGRPPRGSRLDALDDQRRRRRRRHAVRLRPRAARAVPGALRGTIRPAGRSRAALLLRGLARGEGRGHRAGPRPAKRRFAPGARAHREPRVLAARLAVARAPTRHARAADRKGAMIPNLDLLLGTIERALEVAILPNATNASAREE